MISVPVYRRFSDLDPLGHVNNVAYHDYLQEARMGLIGDLDAIVNPDYSQIVVKQEIRHRRPLGHSRQPIHIDVRIEAMAGSTYTIGYRILDDNGELAAEATTLMAVVTTSDGTPIRIPEELRAQLTPHLQG